MPSLPMMPDDFSLPFMPYQQVKKVTLKMGIPMPSLPYALPLPYIMPTSQKITLKI